jgi:hypothetical protein
VLVSRAPIRVEGRRLRAIRLSLAAATSALALLVVAFVAWLVAQLAALALLALLAGLCAVGAIVITARHTWRRFNRRGRLLFGLPVVLGLLAALLAGLGLPGASVAGVAAGIALVATIAVGVVARPAVTPVFGLAPARVDASFLRSEEPAESLTVVLDQGGVHFGADDASGSEVWRAEEIAAVRLDDEGECLVLRVADRLGDEIAVEIDPGFRTSAEKLVEHLDVSRR